MVSELWRRVVATAAVGGLCAGVAACGDPDDNAPHTGASTPPELVIRVVTTDAPSALDPAGRSDVASRTVQGNVFQTLLTILPGKPTPVPDAADCQFDSPTTYTCSLKEGLKFPNGHDLTSSDVRFSFERMVGLKTPGGPAALFASVTSVSTPDELTAVFNLKAPDARLPYLLTTTGASIVDEESYPKNKLLESSAVGSGPYQLTAYKPGESVTLAKFAAYKGSRGPRNDGVLITTVKDAVALNREITAGKADLAYRGFTIGQLDKLRTSDKVQVVESADASIQAFAFQLRSATARKPGVRRAIAQLIDRPALVKKAYAEHVDPLYSLVPPGFGGATEAFRSEYKQPNKAAAAALLKGVALPVPLTVGWTPSQYGPGAKAEVLELKRQLDASGLFRVTLRAAEWPQYQQAVRAGSYDLFHVGWVPEYPDADDYLAPFIGTGGPFPIGYRSAAANRLLQQERSEQNGIRRDELLGQLQEVFAREVPVLPVWQGRLTVVGGADLENVSGVLDPLGFLHLSALRK
ncbi:ABC transporter substrate-binding protein [Kribbella sandramycini]|uniref:ABC transporter substrate-binding protein n=1 Tax=Kribbella sandramycini TaxID=60450 RepID=A0A7Y4KZK5_9ACTN|nr:ABC transporter substrate-binding protein [Kribbella sandramycini]MBB6569590.1 peptide/nickel transport system substrate-binding protein [Kribbella sandramycini]NOL40576.1 ABC transporter substrate-binding protein [Kribbella sandramycini]